MFLHEQKSKTQHVCVVAVAALTLGIPLILTSF